MPLRVAEDKVFYSIPLARSIRELGRISGVSHSTAKRIIDCLSRRGKLVPVFNDEYFGFTRVIFLGPRNKRPGSLPYGSLIFMNFSSPLSGHSMVIGYVPRVLSTLYVSALLEIFGDGEAIVARDVAYWLPVEKTRDLASTSIIRFAENIEGILPRFAKREPLKMPDSLDLAFLTGKLYYGPYARAWEIVKKFKHALKQFPPTYQVASYHYRLHFLPGWIYTTYLEKRDPNEAPRVVLLLKGKESDRVARAMAMLPFGGVAYIGNSVSLYVGQPEVKYLQEIYDLAHAYRVELQEGIQFVREEVELEIPHLWRFLDQEGERWSWVEERVRVPSYN